MKNKKIISAIILSLGILIPALLMGVARVSARSAVAETSENCLSCHGDKNLTMILGDGEALSLFVSNESLDHSIHQKYGLECIACHVNLGDHPSQTTVYASRRELSVALYQECKVCHSSNYEKTLDSIHAEKLKAGDADAPICTDCHGSHEISATIEPKAAISRTCGNCHAGILSEYANSVHGAAVIEQGNQDVPVCTDCHGVHNIADARTTEFRVASPEMCARCHSDSTLMDKYGLSADVYSIYKTSWHGVDVSVYKAKWPTIWHDSAVCSDCHGVHNIYATDDARSLVNEANLLSTCQKCHPAAGSNWTGAWTGHNKITLEKSPTLYYIDLFYSTFTPTILWMCVIYVALQVIRQMVDKIRSKMP